MRKLLPVLLAVCGFSFRGADSAELHQFTNKSGQNINAELLEVQSDRKKIRIRREDGGEFAIDIVSLSLEDQLYIKKWMETKASTVDYRLDLKLEKKQVDSEVRSRNPYVIEYKDVAYQITVRNLSRETLESPVLEYVLIRREGVEHVKLDDGDWSYSIPSSTSDRRELVRGRENLESMAFNNEAVITTKPTEIEEVSYENSTLYEDVAEGIMVRVLSKEGRVLEEARTGLAVIDDYTWQEFGSDNTGTPEPESDSRMSRTDTDEDTNSYSLYKGDVVNGPIDFSNKSVSITANVSQPDSGGEGVILAIGGNNMGISLFVQGKQVVAMQAVRGKRQTVSAPLPFGNFAVSFQLSEGALSLALNKDEPVVAESLGLFPTRAVDGIQVGKDNNPRVGTYEDSFQYPGAIRDVQITFEE